MEALLGVGTADKMNGRIVERSRALGVERRVFLPAGIRVGTADRTRDVR